MASTTKLLTVIALMLSTAASAQVVLKKCYCSVQDLSPNAPPMEQRVNVQWTAQACADQGYMDGNACIVAADPVREDHFQDDCLELPGLSTTGCI
ncbi:hypothetical protein CH063_05454 [Colletotrichum higginsianum]|uniref:Uncharacterized protein n=1 Tax=Colletotrichum higginsianum (strain IMI 349063) TaxID=759273 RepID=H1UZ14_COLHI|nr:hypothetical protein CH63R_08336 [Colletotrichum higginsianum IMI 349063]OBR09571.1 hypothetical protein CH63R_08336 [Colletotrichum higginsianum IMI 349063]CCF33215.1 hypothetical protein CH063_05454 [Colletotrichum higginsianum]